MRDCVVTKKVLFCQNVTHSKFVNAIKLFTLAKNEKMKSDFIHDPKSFIALTPAGNIYIINSK